MTERFPELAPLAALLPDGTVLDGEILAVAATGRSPFGDSSGGSGASRSARRSSPRSRSSSWPTTCSRTGRGRRGHPLDCAERRSRARCGARSRRVLSPVLERRPGTSSRACAASRERAGRGLHAEAQARPTASAAARRLVEVEDRSLHDRCRPRFTRSPASGKRARASTPTTPSASGTRASSSRSPRRTRA